MARWRGGPGWGLLEPRGRGVTVVLRRILKIMWSKSRTYFAKTLLGMLVTGLLFQGSVGSGVAENVREAKVKAAFVVNFSRFINWPDDSFASGDSPLLICTVGVDAIQDAFAGVEAKKVRGRSIALKRLQSLSEARDQCHIVYMGSLGGDQCKAYLEENKQLPVVSISGEEGFANDGGTIQFIKTEDRLSFKINNSEARKRHLSINASLLNLAEEVY
jgi:hypothetical protein